MNPLDHESAGIRSEVGSFAGARDVCGTRIDEHATSVAASMCSMRRLALAIALGAMPALGQHWLLDPAGPRPPEQWQATPSPPTSMWPIDVDGDGIDELIGVNGGGTIASSGELWIWRATGDRWVGSRLLPGLSGAVVAAEAIADDFDRDGDQDFLIVGVLDLTGWEVIAALFVNESGTLVPASAASLGSLAEVTRIAVGDVDGDGDGDAVVALRQLLPGAPATSSTFNLLRFDAGAMTLDPAAFPVGASSVRITPVLLDADRDGDLDMVAGMPQSGLVYYVNDSGSGRFLPGAPPFPNGGDVAFAADVDQDGFDDVLFASWFQITVAWNRPTGLEFGGSVGSARDVFAIVDTDGDGSVEALRSEPGRLELLEWDGAAFAPRDEILMAPYDLEEIAPLRVSGGPGDDLLGLWRTRANRPGPLVLYRSSSAGLVRDAGLANLANPDSLVDVAHRLDLDGDGRTDVLSGSIAWLHRPPTAERRMRWERMDLPVTVSASTWAADFDRDGLPDLLATDTRSGLLELYLQGPSGGFQFLSSFAFPGGHRDVAVGDWDADGDIDLAILIGSGVVPMENLGVGRFRGRPLIPVAAAAAQTISTLDADRDGRTDLAIGSSAGGCLEVLRNVGALSFAADTHCLVPVAMAPTAIVAADVTGDGVEDLILAEPRAPQARIEVMQGQPGGGFTATGPAFPAVSFAEIGAVHALDVDGDRDLDIVIASDRRAFLFTNDGSGRFAPLAVAPWQVENLFVPIDVDDDGDVDLVGNPGRPIWNHTRSLFSTSIPRLGGSLDYAVSCEPGSSSPGARAFVAIAPRLAAPLEFPGIQNRLLLDPGSITVFPFVTLPAGVGFATLRTAIPPSLAIVGAEIFAQALVVSPRSGFSFTALEREVVLP